MAEMKMLRLSLGVLTINQFKNDHTSGAAHVRCVGDKSKEVRVRWFGLV